MSDDKVYEPRALWSVLRVQPSVVGRQSIASFDREHFRNGTRNPIVLTHMLLSPVGYTFKQFEGVNTPPLNLEGDVDACGTALQKCRLLVRSPDRRPFAFRPNLLPSAPALPTNDISMIDSAQPYSAGLANTIKWVFEKPLIIPRFGLAEMAIGCPLLPDIGSTGAEVSFELGFFEEYSLVGGSARSHRSPLEFFNTDTGSPPYPYFMADGLAFGQGTTQDLYPPRQQFTRTRWRAQEATVAGSTKIKGFSLAIDQIAYEDFIQTAGAPYADAPLASLLERTPVGVAQLFGCGSEQEWWRPDIPAALLGVTMGPAQVCPLGEPIVLHPGDTLDAELQFPGAQMFGAVEVAPTYQVGLSFNGYSAIEG